MDSFFNDILAQISDAHNEVMGALPIPSYEDLTEGPGVLSGLTDFAAVINWSEPFFKYLAGFHVCLYLFCFIWSRNNSNRTAVCLGISIVLGLAMPALNDLGSEHHASIFVLEKGMNYFDSNGTFLSALFGAPIVLLSVLLQIKLLYYVAVMMIKLKRAQLKHSMREKEKEGGAKKPSVTETSKTK